MIEVRVRCTRLRFTSSSCFLRDNMRLKFATEHRTTTGGKLDDTCAFSETSMTIASTLSSESRYAVRKVEHPLPFRATRSGERGEDRFMLYSQDMQLIYRLFGLDLEKYLSEHIEQYEAAKTRWRGCTTEEWREGANGWSFKCSYSSHTISLNYIGKPESEITEKFHKLIDFVRCCLHWLF